MIAFKITTSYVQILNWHKSFSSITGISLWCCS